MLIVSYITFAIGLLFGSVEAVKQSPGCGKALVSGIKTGGVGSSNNLTITSSGLQRNYFLHLPTAYSSTDPHGLVFSFHGRSDTASNQERICRFSESSINPHMLAVYPEGIEQQWQGDPAATTDDVTFTLDMIEAISQQYCIDLEKVYATGYSNGGGLAANILACDPIASTKIAAFGGFAGAYYQTSDPCNGATVPITCNPGRKPVPILEMHGSADPVIAYDGGARRSKCLPSLPHFMTEWARRNDLGTGNVSQILGGGKAVKYEFGASKGLSGINTHYWVKDMGHVWAATGEVDGSALAMEFFEKWTLGAVSSGVPSSTVVSSASTSVSSSSTSTKSSTVETKTTLTTSTSLSKPSTFETKTTPTSTSLTPSTASTKTTPTSTPASSASVTPSTASTKTTSSSISTSAKPTSPATPTPSTYPSPTCPDANGSTFTTPENNKFKIYCGYDTSANYYGNPLYDLSFGKCIKACQDDVNCGHANYNGVCYLKKSVNGAKAIQKGSVNLAVKLG